MEQKSKLTLIVDGNWLLMSRISVLMNKYASERDMMKDAKILMLKSINIVLKQFPCIDNIIFVADHGSWRNKIKTPEFLKSDGVEYKGNRVKSDDINWDIVFSEYDDLINVLQANGIQISHHQDIEGDDWCYYWSRRLNKEGTNCIIWSRDKDLTQLVNRDENGYFTVIWSKESGLICKVENTDEYFSPLLNPYYMENNNVQYEIIQHTNKVTQIDPNSIVIDKIIRGDAGDNILPILTRTSKKSTTQRVYRISAKELPESLDIYDENQIHEYIDGIMESKAFKGKIDKDNKTVFDHFIYNRSLVVLNLPSYPPYILNIFKEYDEAPVRMSSISNMKNVEAELVAEKNEIRSLLDEI